MMTTADKDILEQLERLRNPDSSVKRDAIEFLTGIRDERVIYPLIKALQDEDQGVQQAAIDALIAYKDEVTVYNVLPLLFNDRVAVRNMAQEILEKIGETGIDLLGEHIKVKDEDVKKMISDILGKLNRPEVIPLLLEMLKDPNLNVRSSAAEGLGRIGDSTVMESLINLLNDDEWVAFFAVVALGRIGNKRSIRPLTGLIKSGNIELQIASIEAIGQIGGDKAIESLLDSLDSLRPESLNAAIGSILRLTHGNIEKLIERYGNDRAFDYLAEAVNDIDIDESEVKRDFILAFSLITNPKSSVYILKLISDTDTDTDNAAIVQVTMDALTKLKDEDLLIKSLQEENSARVLVSIRVLGMLKSSRAIQALKALFIDSDRDIQIEILHALSRIGGKDSTEFLVDMLSYGEGHVRSAAARGLGELTDTSSVESMLNRLEEEEYSDVVGEIVNALVKIEERHKDPSIIKGLTSNLSNSKSYVREAVLKAIGILGHLNSAELIKHMVSDENWRVRRACIETLSQLNAPGLLDVLITAGSDEKDEVRMLVAQLTGRYSKEKSIDILINLLTDRNDRIIYKAIEGLARLNAIKAIPYLIKLSQKGDLLIQKMSIWALGELSAREAEDTLKLAFNHKDEEIRDAAIDAYRKIRAVSNVII